MADGAIDKLTISIGASSTAAVRNINTLANALRELRTAVSVIDSGSAKKITELADALRGLKGIGTVKLSDKLPEQLRSISETANGISSEAISKLERLSQALGGLKGASLGNISKALNVTSATGGTAAHEVSGTTSTGGGTALEETKEKAKEATNWFQKLKVAAAEASKGIEKVEKSSQKSTGALGNFASALKRIAMYRFLRTIIKEITEAFKEGLQNAYLFSSGISGESHRFATAMDNMKSAGLTMKNQLGSAFIALLTAIQPIITTIINLITRLADAMSQFFAVFTGGRYLKANAVSQQFADTMGSGAKAAKEWKNQLLGFDVINRLEAPSDGGGGGGSNALNPASMFEDAEIDGIFKKMKDKLDELKNSLNFEPLINAWNHLKEAVKGFADVVLDYLAAAWDKILVPLAHWVIEEAAPRLVELLAKAFEFLSAVLERLKPVFEWVWEHILKPIAEFVGDAFLSFLDSVIDLLGKLTDLISGKTTFGEFLKSLSPGQAILLGLAAAFIVVHGAISLFNGILIAVFLGVGALSTALSALLSPIGLVILAIGALIAIGVALYQNWDSIKAKFAEAGEELRGDWERTKEFFSSSAESIKQAFSNLGHSIAAPFKQGAAEIRADMERIKAIVQSAINSIKQAFENVKNAIIGIFQNLGSAISNIISSIVSKIQGLISSIRNAFSSIGSIGGMFGFGVPKYASGGIPEDGIFMANHNELVGQCSNGKTAVANNQEITAGIASAVYGAFMAALEDTSSGGGQKTEFVFNLNGREFARAIYNDQNAVQREHGVSYLANA